MDFFEGETTFQALEGAASSNFTRARDWSSLASAHPQGGQPPPQKKMWKFKIWPKIQRVGVNNFRLVEVSPRNFFSRRAVAARGISTTKIDFPLGLAALGGLTSGSALYF